MKRDENGLQKIISFFFQNPCQISVKDNNKLDYVNNINI